METQLKNYLLKNEIKYCLVGKIKGLVEETKKTNLLLKKKKYPKRNWIYIRRQEVLSNSTRYHLLAYAFLSGKPYKSVEAKCQKLPSAKEIFKIVSNNYQEWYITYNKITEETIAKWLEG